MDRKKHLDTAANKLSGILDQYSQGLSASEVDAKSFGLAEVAAKAEDRATARSLLRSASRSRF
jgi:hypothetical protein